MSTYDVNTRTARWWWTVRANCGVCGQHTCAMASRIVVVAVVWVMKYHGVRSATCHCKGLGRVLTRRTRATPSNSERRSVLHPPLLHKIYVIVSSSSSPQWMVTRDSRAAWKRRLGGRTRENKDCAQLAQSHFRSLNWEDRPDISWIRIFLILSPSILVLLAAIDLYRRTRI